MKSARRVLTAVVSANFARSFERSVKYVFVSETPRLKRADPFIKFKAAIFDWGELV
jgi:hypothetical protein